MEWQSLFTERHSMTNLLKLSEQFPLKPSEVGELYDLARLADVSFNGRNVNIECMLVTDSWEVFAYPNRERQPQNKRGATDYLNGTGYIWVNREQNAEDCVDTLIHEFAHLFASVVIGHDVDHHGPVFDDIVDEIEARIAEAIEDD